MPVKQHVDARTLGNRFAELVRKRDLSVQEIWARNGSGFPELWIVIEPMDLSSELPVHRAVVDLHREFPDALFEDQVLNPAWFPNYPVENAIPHDATRIDFRR